MYHSAHTIRGWTLLEITTVVVILGIVAAVAVPGFVKTDSKKLDVAAEMVAGAMRYAQSEAQRTRTVHYVSVNRSTQQIKLSVAELTTSPVTEKSTLYHPINKQLYDFQLNTGTFTGGVTIGNNDDVFLYPTIGRSKNLLFDENGIPVWIATPAGTTYPLSDATIVLKYGSQQRIVKIDPGTGRVSIQ